ncbi:uncharacterized protein LOC106714194 [Papilio machaon]|uniref:uncharacterized protein LOC106714194 n=1 Tax=Papilio machaon TaxID=76193 RepID=UPI001E664369|nr:uncharacterized protein LOC106714194 [Papilio machaon]
MDIIVTTFTNPFKFFCYVKGAISENVYLDDFTMLDKLSYDVSKVDHGQYVAVMWKNKWTRGIISMENQFLIWLIDHGIFLRPDKDTIYVDLPQRYKTYPSKVFEASIHGVIPVDKVISQECQITNGVTTEWNKGAIEKAQELIKNARNTYFVPLALMKTKYNDVILGDLYLEKPGNRLMNFIQELELWPVFLECNKKAYINNLQNFYTSRRKHRACFVKPNVIDSNMPVMTLETNLVEYNAICVKQPEFSLIQNSEGSSIDGSTVLDIDQKGEKTVYKLTHDEIEKYADMNITLHGREYNALKILVNKIRDLNICERYKDHDLKTIGCGITTRRCLH